MLCALQLGKLQRLNIWPDQGDLEGGELALAKNFDTIIIINWELDFDLEPRIFNFGTNHL